ncbi:nucleotide exchange factor GrpE [Priestia megaterium]
MGRKIENQQSEQYNTIDLANIKRVEINSVSIYLNMGLMWNSICLVGVYNKCFSKVHTSIINKFGDQTDQMKQWEKSICSIRDTMDLTIEETYYVIRGGQDLMSEHDAYLTEVRELIADLQPIKILDSNDKEEDLNFNGLEHSIKEIKDEVKKGNRVSFKSIQEVQQAVENLLTLSSETNNTNIKSIIEGYDKKIESFLNLTLKAVDSLNMIHDFAKKTNLHEWVEQISEITKDFLHSLASFGIEEIEAEGMFFDGEIMISIGTAPPQVAPHLEKYQVYSVVEKGFRYSETNQLIREAKVITIY